MPVTQYTWDPLTDSVLEETDGAGNVRVTYTNEPTLHGPLLSEDRGGTPSQYHFDALGSTRALTDDTGTVIDTFDYDAWGNEVARAGATPTDYTWCGRWGYQQDASSIGGYYVRARIYQSTDARWVTVDPLWSPQDTNAYRYAESRPALLVDPSGLVVRDFDPANVKAIEGMAWCAVGVSTNLDPDNVSDPSIAGETVPKPYKITCACQCCDKDNNKYSLLCIVQAHFQIKINKFAQRLPQQTYGHEQRHVKNLLEGAEIWAKAAAASEAKVGCGPLSLCRWEKQYLEFVGNNALQNWITREKEHGLDNPRENTGYWPLPDNAPGPHGGPFPTSPDCSKPGQPSPVPKDDKCC